MSTTRDWDMWRSSPGARSPAEKEWDDVPDYVQGPFLRYMERWLEGDITPSGGDCKRLGQWDVLYFRVRIGNNQYRLYFKVHNSVAHVLCVVHKKQQRIDKKTLERIGKRARALDHRE